MNGLTLLLQVSLTVAEAMRSRWRPLEDISQGTALTSNQEALTYQTCMLLSYSVNAVPSATSDGNAPSERENSVISGRQQLANGQKMVTSANRKGSIKQTNTSQVLVSETVPDRRVQPSRRAKMTRFGGQPCDQHCANTT